MTTGPATCRFGGSTGIDDHLPGKHDQSSHGRGKGGIRRSLANAKTPEEIAAAVATEASALVGDTVDVNFAGADPEVARGFGEGILRGLERYPATPLREVGTYGPGGSGTHNATVADAGSQSHSASAFALRGGEQNGSGGKYQVRSAELPNGSHTTGTAIYLNLRYATPSGFDTMAAGQKGRKRTDRGYVATTPMAMALHEFGHAAGYHGRPNQPEAAVAAAARDKATAAGVSARELITRGVSSYAATDHRELAAEVFADVMANGPKASRLSRELFDTFDENARGWDAAATKNRVVSPVNAVSDIDLSRLQAEFERQLDALLRRWTDITTAQRRQIVDQVRVAVTSNDLAALARLHVSTSEAAALLTEAMGQMALDAAREVVHEAAAQGVRIDPVASDRTGFHVVAEALTALLAEGLTNSAGREALRRWSPSTTGDDVAAAVDEHLASLSDAFVRDNLGGAMMAALTTGRVETMLAAPAAAIYASEYMDRNTCKPCRQINGKWIGNSDDPDIATKIQAVYPNGGYRDCLGGVRCRGTVVSVFRPDQTAGGPQVTVGA